MRPDGHGQEIVAVISDSDQSQKINKKRRVVGSERQTLAKDLVRRYMSGQSIRALAASTDRSYGFVHRILTESGVQLRQRGGARRRRRIPASTARPPARDTAREFARVGQREPTSPTGSPAYVVANLIPATGRPTLFIISASKDFEALLKKAHSGQQGTDSGTVSVDAYIKTDDEVLQQAVLTAVDALVADAGFDGPFDVEVRRGSIFRRSRAALRRGIDSAEVPQRLAKVERALELNYLDRHQAEVDATKAGAVQQLLDSLANVPQACIRVGSIFLLKYENTRGPVVLIRTLSQLEIHALEKYPEIQTDPPKALEALATAVAALEPADMDNALLQLPPEG